MKLIPITDIFDIRYGNQFDLSKMDILTDGSDGINFVSRTSENNGSMATVGIYNDIDPFEAGLITVTLGGSYLLASFIQPKPFYTGQNIKVLTPKFPLSTQEKLFYCTCIEANRFRYSSHSREANSTFNQITLPAPEEIPESVKKYNLDDKFNEKPLSAKNLTLETEKWKVFYMKDIFNLSLGRPIHANELEELKSRGYPYVTRTAENNGMEGFIDEEFEEYLNKGGVITVGAEGFTAFYQDRDFYNGNKVNIIKHSKLENKYVSIFVSTLLDKEIKGRFSYGRGAVKGKLETMKIKLPVTPTGEPDWQWMEEYVKSLPYSSSL